jgi:hypothetical protein
VLIGNFLQLCPYDLTANARINEQSLAGGFFAAQREKGDR